MIIRPNPRIKYSIITEEKARKYFENGYKNIFYNSTPWRGDISESLILWINYNDDIDQWEELDKYFGGNWWQLDSVEFVRRFGNVDTKVNSVISKTGNDIISDPWNDKPIAHKDTSGFKLGDWSIENYPFYITDKDLKDITRYQDPIRLKSPMKDKVCKDSQAIKEPKPEHLTQFQQNLKVTLDSLYDMLSRKNRAYGNSALKPLTCFSNANSSDVIRQQIDHKLSRIKNAENPSKNDVADLIGYLLLYTIDQGWSNFNDQ